MSSVWNPAQYEKFRTERSQPFFDLVALCRPIPGGRAIDLGCGTGELTRVLHETTSARSTVGLDNSETMLERSGQFVGGGLRFRLGTILRFAPRVPYDLVFSNAALQWVDDHPRLLERLAAGVGATGQIAVQMPANHDHPSHETAFELADEEPWRTELSGYNRAWPVLPPERYAELLDRLGFRHQTVRLQVYVHHLENREAVIEWVRGTLLTDYQRRMEPDVFDRFLAAYRARLLPRLPDQQPFLYTFKRILFWASR